MSDYLWDKTGEPDENVEQLEQLLGALKYQPRPLELPATVLPARSRMIFSRPRLALAASLVLMLLTGVWLVTMRQGEQEMGQPLVATKANSPQEKKQEAEKRAEIAMSQPTPIDRISEPTSRKDRTGIIPAAATAKPPRTSPRLMAKEKRQIVPPRGAERVVRQREQIAVTKEGREATEKLMLALRLASAKLNYAQREVQEVSRLGH